MKRFFKMMMVTLLLAGYSIGASAQKNIDKQPAWGPVGYEVASYYYMPDLNIYYDVANALFYFLSGGSWTANQYLPSQYRTYDLYSIYKVVINDEPKPWINNKTHKKLYKEYKKDKTQTPIRYSTDSRYNKSKENAQPWVEHKQTGNADKGQKKSSTKKDGNSSKEKQNSDNRGNNHSKKN